MAKTRRVKNNECIKDKDKNIKIQDETHQGSMEGLLIELFNGEKGNVVGDIILTLLVNSN